MIPHPTGPFIQPEGRTAFPLSTTVSSVRCLLPVLASPQSSDSSYPAPVLRGWPCVQPHLEKRRAVAADPQSPSSGSLHSLPYCEGRCASQGWPLRSPTAALPTWVGASHCPLPLSHDKFFFPFQWIAHINIQRCYYFSYFRKRPTSLLTHNPSNYCFVLKLFGRDAYPGCLQCLSGTHFYFWPLLKFVFSKLPITSTQSIFSVFRWINLINDHSYIHLPTQLPNENLTGISSLEHHTPWSLFSDQACPHAHPASKRSAHPYHPSVNRTLRAILALPSLTSHIWPTKNPVVSIALWSSTVIILHKPHPSPQWPGCSEPAVCAPLCSLSAHLPCGLHPGPQTTQSLDLGMVCHHPQ